MRLLVLAAACLCFWAGCIEPLAAPSVARSALTGSPEWEAACSLAHATSIDGTPCVTFFDGGPGRDLEPSIAAHPKDPRTALVAWTARGGDVVQAWAAFTRDGGATWATTRMHDPSLLSLPGGTYSWDVTAAFLPDGTAAVLFAGESQLAEYAGGVLDPVSRITLALSSDGGATWAYRRVAEDPSALAWDYTHLAVAPDTGDLYVTAYSAAVYGNGVWLFVSRDAGATWEKRPSPLGADVLAHTGARVVAGPGGLVLIVTETSVEGLVQERGQATFATLSTDAGRTFGPARPIAQSGLVRGAPALWTDPDGAARIDAIVTTPEGAVRARSPDGGRTWSAQDLIAPAPEGMEGAWAVGAASRAGGLGVLITHESVGPLRWGADFLHEGADGARTSLALVPTLDGHPAPPKASVREGGTGTGTGDEYGGLAFAADGAAWAAWADPRGVDGARIAVARLVAEPS